MANINSIMDMWKSSATVSNITGQSRLYHIFDALRQYACFGVNIRQYTKRTYRMRNFELRQTITDNQWGKIRRKFNNQKYEYLFENKVEFNRKFAQFIKRDWIASKDGNTIRDFIAKHGKVIVKPIKEMQGMGIHITNHYDEKYSATEYLFEEIIQQHPDMMLNNKALNTIRVYSVLSSNNNKDSVKIVKTCLRGGVGNAVVDNFCAGGICYPIDENTGIIYGSGNDRTFTTEYLIHPGTDIIMIGKVIPYWDKIIEMIKRAALVIPEVRLVGWDVAITSNGVQIIEGNHNPGIQMLEYVGRGQHLKQILSYL